MSSAAIPASIQLQLEAKGFVVCPNFPVDSPDALTALAATLGSPQLDIDEELSGPPLMVMKFDPVKAARTERPAYFSSNAFPLHTDMSYVVNPPRYLFMLCVVPDAGGGGETILSDCRRAWSALNAGEQKELSMAQFTFRNPPNTPAGDCGLLPVAQVTPEWRLWRYRLDGMNFPQGAAGAVRAFSNALEQGAFSFALAAGDLLIVDNHMMAHGRTAFNPGASDNARHLLRTYAQDAQRSAELKRLR